MAKKGEDQWLELAEVQPVSGKAAMPLICITLSLHVIYTKLKITKQ